MCDDGEIHGTGGLHDQASVRLASTSSLGNQSLPGTVRSERRPDGADAEERHVDLLSKRGWLASAAELHDGPLLRPLARGCGGGDTHAARAVPTGWPSVRSGSPASRSGHVRRRAFGICEEPESAEPLWAEVSSAAGDAWGEVGPRAVLRSLATSLRCLYERMPRSLSATGQRASRTICRRRRLPTNHLSKAGPPTGWVAISKGVSGRPS